MNARARVVSRSLATIVAVVAALPLVALALRCGGGVRAAGALDGALAFVCHRIPARSFQICGAETAVCGRCFGIYAGVALGALLPARPPVARTRASAVAAGFALAAELLLERAAAIDPGNTVRAAVGLAVGLTFALHVRTAIDAALRPRPRSGPA